MNRQHATQVHASGTTNNVFIDCGEWRDIAPAEQNEGDGGEEMPGPNKVPINAR